jgi:hypothetical protein
VGGGGGLAGAGAGRGEDMLGSLLSLSLAVVVGWRPWVFCVSWDVGLMGVVRGSLDVYIVYKRVSLYKNIH